MLGEHEHDVAAGIVITSEAGCEFGNLAGERLTASEMIRRTPIKTPTFVAAPKRLAALQAIVQPAGAPYDRLTDNQRYNLQMDYWGVKSYENDDAGDALDAGFARVHGALRRAHGRPQPSPFRASSSRDLRARKLWTRRSRLCGKRSLYEDPPEEWDETARLALSGIVVRHAELGISVPPDWLNRAIDWLRNEDIEWEEATARRLRRQKEIELLRRPDATSRSDQAAKGD